MTDKFKDQDSMLPAATSDKKKISAKPGKSGQVIINPPEKVDPQRGFQERFQALRAKHSVVLEKKTELVLQSKATRSEFPQEVIEQVYKRGFKALPLNTELTREQYAMNRVNSFIAGGAAMVEDYDLLPITERIHTRIGMKGTGGGARPHIKREKSPYNGRTVFHVVDAKGIVKHSTGDEFEAKKHLASKYNTYMGESTISPLRRFEGTKSLVKTYKKDTPGEGKKDVSEVFADQGSGSTAKDNAEYMKRRNAAKKLKGNQVKLDKNNNNKLDAEDFKLLRKEEVKKGLYYYVNRRKRLGISRDKDHSKAPEPQDWKNAAKTAKEEVDLSELNKDTLYSYASKADKDITKKHNELGAQIRADKNVEANKTSMKISNRDKGLDRAQARLNKESAICASCQVDPCICDESHGFVGEARMSASERFSRAFDKQRAKSDASLRRTPSSIPKKEEPKKEESK
jgi:hypothetical protein